MITVIILYIVNLSSIFQDSKSDVINMTDNRRLSDGMSSGSRIIEIVLDHPNGHYNAGDTVVGNVILHLPRPIRIKGKYVRCNITDSIKITMLILSNYFIYIIMQFMYSCVHVFIYSCIHPLSRLSSTSRTKII